jgi:hypothetical protein
MNKRAQVTKYVVADLVAAAAAWTIFYLSDRQDAETLAKQSSNPVHIHCGQYY